MHRFCLVLLVLAGSASSGLAADGFGFGGSYDPFAAPPAAGLRFGGEVINVTTGAVEGGYAPAGPGYGPGCSACDSCFGGICLDWKLNTWRGSWDDGHHGWHGRRACASCGY